MSSRVESPWTPELIQRLKMLWGQGLPTAEIGLQLGLGKNAVIAKAHRLGLEGRPSPLKRPPAPKYVPPARGCMWPSGHPGEKGFRFCGAAPKPGKPYCAVHCAAAYVAPEGEKAAPLKSVRAR